jgi:translation initiation factor IF-1
MPKADFIETEGTITRMRGHGFYTVALANGHEVLARMSGRMTKNHIRVIQDDRVLLEIPLQVVRVSSGPADPARFGSAPPRSLAWGCGRSRGRGATVFIIMHWCPAN